MGHQGNDLSRAFGADAPEGDPRSSRPLSWWSGVIEIAAFLMPYGFENVALIDGFTAVKAVGKLVLIRLMFYVIEEALLAGAMPAAGNRRVYHGLFSADWAFVASFGLNLLKNVSTKFVDVLLAF